MPSSSARAVTIAAPTTTRPAVASIVRICFIPLLPAGPASGFPLEPDCQPCHRPRTDASRVTEEFSTEHRLRGRRRARPREALAKYRNPPPHMDHVHVPMLLPDITFDTRPTDYLPVNQMQLRLRRHVLARLWRHRQRLAGPASYGCSCLRRGPRGLRRAMAGLGSRHAHSDRVRP